MSHHVNANIWIEERHRLKKYSMKEISKFQSEFVRKLFKSSNIRWKEKNHEFHWNRSFSYNSMVGWKERDLIEKHIQFPSFLSNAGSAFPISRIHDKSLEHFIMRLHIVCVKVLDSVCVLHAVLLLVSTNAQQPRNGKTLH